jgi:hypothetical protein
VVARHDFDDGRSGCCILLSSHEHAETHKFVCSDTQALATRASPSPTPQAQQWSRSFS